MLDFYIFILKGYTMDKISEAIIIYESLINKKYIYDLSNGNSLEVNFKKENFPHLIGFHKLIDIIEFNKLNNKTIKGNKVFNMVKNKDIKSEKIMNSPNYEKIILRVDNFHAINELIFNKVIYDFDKTKVRTYINADLVLYAKKDLMYVHLFLIKNKFGKYVPVTFIVDQSDKYIKDQKSFSISKLRVQEKKKDTQIYNYI